MNSPRFHLGLHGGGIKCLYLTQSGNAIDGGQVRFDFVETNLPTISR